MIPEIGYARRRSKCVSQGCVPFIPTPPPPRELLGFPERAKPDPSHSQKGDHDDQVESQKHVTLALTLALALALKLALALALAPPLALALAPPLALALTLTLTLTLSLSPTRLC